MSEIYPPARSWCMWYLPTVTWGLLIIVTAVIPIPAPPFQTPLLSWDTLAHAIVYGIFALLVARSLHGSMTATPTAGALIVQAVNWTISMGVLCEALQWTIPYRSASWNDLLADAIGAVLASTAYVYVLKSRKAA